MLRVNVLTPAYSAVAWRYWTEYPNSPWVYHIRDGDAQNFGDMRISIEPDDRQKKCLVFGTVSFEDPDRTLRITFREYE